MKTVSIAAVFAALICSSAQGQSRFKADLFLTVPPPYPQSPAYANFSLDDASTTFHVMFEEQYIAATGAHIIGPDTDFTFDLGPGFGAIHSPIDGRGGFKAFAGSFTLPDALREDFIAGRTTLLITSPSGDYQGVITATPEPSTGLLLVGGAAACLRRQSRRLRRE